MKCTRCLVLLVVAAVAVASAARDSERASAEDAAQLHHVAKRQAQQLLQMVCTYAVPLSQWASSVTSMLPQLYGACAYAQLERVFNVVCNGATMEWVPECLSLVTGGAPSTAATSAPPAPVAGQRLRQVKHAQEHHAGQKHAAHKPH